MLNKPKFYRPIQGHWIGWEWHSFRSFFITIALGSLEITINKWGPNKRVNGVDITKVKLKLDPGGTFYDDAVTKITEIIDQSVTGIDKPSYGRINPPGRGLIEINDHTPLVPLPPLEYLTDADASQLTRAVRCPFCHEPAKVDTVTSQIICENEENLASEFRRRMNEVYRRLSD